MKHSIKGNIVDVFNRCIYPGEIHVVDGRIKAIVQNEEVYDRFILPGFIDAHVHVESSMLVPSEFARLAVCHGTVATISDPHEIGNVLGIAGVRFMLENGAKTPFKFHFGAPSCVPATYFETAGAEITGAEIREILTWPRVNYLAEVMNFPGVIHKDPIVMEKISIAHELGKVVDGHAPGLRGELAKKYIDAGISTDHECFTLEEAEDKLRFGMKIIIREGSAAKNFEALWSLIDRYPGRIMLCSDDKHPNDLAKGHINRLVARAIEKGCELFNVLQAACTVPVEHYSMDVGLLRAGDPADFCVVNDLTYFDVLETYIDGERVAENGTSFIPSVVVDPINKFDCSPISEAQLKFEAAGNAVRAIVVEDGQLITGEYIAKLPIVDSCFQADTESDVLKIAVVNRYHDAPVAVAFVKNFGLIDGAIASCVAHDSHNIICVGTNDTDMTVAINAIIAAKGGVSLAAEATKMIVELPVAGIMTAKDGYSIGEAYEHIDKAAKELGASLAAPYMTLSFCALLVIPRLKLSDKGLFDGDRFEFVDVALNA